MNTRIRALHILVGDAGVLIGFLASDQHRQLRKLISDKLSHFQWCVPHVVEEEIHRWAAKNRMPTVRTRWEWLSRVGPVLVLPPVTHASDPVLVANAARLLDRQDDELLEDTHDLGEAFVIAHALSFQAAGRTVVVAIDDSAGARWAREQEFTNLDTLDLLSMCAKSGIYTSRRELRAAFDAVSKRSRLPTWAKTELPGLFR